MKIFLIAILIAFVAAQQDKDATIVAEESEANPDAGTYKWSFRTSNGIERQESGAVKQITPEDAGMTSKGSWTYTVNGEKVEFSFVADENGYQPNSKLLPVGPPMPLHVQRLLASLAKKAKA